MAFGAVAGLAGSLTMHAFRLVWESGTNNQPELGIFGFDHEADVNATRLLCSSFMEQSISEEKAAKMGLALHYAFGAGIGTLYALLASRKPQVRAGFGTAFGSFVWLFADEIPISVSGISHPMRKKVASHAGALAAHLLFGFTLEAVSKVAAHRRNSS